MTNKGQWPCIEKAERHYLIRQTFQERRLQLRHERLQASTSLCNQQAQRAQDGRLYLPCKAVADDPNERACTPHHHMAMRSQRTALLPMQVITSPV